MGKNRALIPVQLGSKLGFIILAIWLPFHTFILTWREIVVNSFLLRFKQGFFMMIIILCSM